MKETAIPKEQEQTLKFVTLISSSPDDIARALTSQRRDWDA